MRSKKVKRIKILKGDKFMIFIVVLFGFIIMPASWVYTKALLSESDIKLARIKNKIDNQKDANEALSMQIDELASIENIQNIASEKGLSYNNNNIKNIKSSN